MKQRISVEQLDELSPEQQERLREWWRPKKGNLYRLCQGDYAHCFDGEDSENIESFKERIKPFSLPLLSIGQIFKLLGLRIYEISNEQTDIDLIEWEVQFFHNGKDYRFFDKELCNALWQAVKEVLAK